MAYTVPTVSDFKNYFSRDFPYGSSNDTVKNTDIQRAMGEAAFSFNEGLFTSQANYDIGFLLLTAHYLVMDLRASSQGIAGQYSWLENSKSVGSVSQSFAIPQRVLDNPEFSMLSKTNYGAKFLALLLPQLVGQVFTVCGRTSA